MRSGRSSSINVSVSGWLLKGLPASLGAQEASIYILYSSSIKARYRQQIGAEHHGLVIKNRWGAAQAPAYSS